LSWAVLPAEAQVYPAKPVRILVGFPPSGATDLIARILQPALARAFGREIIVENHPGASGVVAADLTAKSAPDGYTLPDVPTVAESGWSDFEASTWYALIGVRRACQRRSSSPGTASSSQPSRFQQVRSALTERGFEPPPSIPGEAEAYLRAETAKWAPLVKALRLQTSN
jgi:tripartite-type tricarboxylate transporter receptor subunit TctC